MRNKHKKVYGFGINNANYAVCPKVDNQNVWCPFYQCWVSMLKRCYSEKYQKKNPTYIDCIVCDKWRTFSNFKSWMEKQDWKGKQLDKDFLGDGKLYSPETCCFVESWLNSLFTDRNAKRGKWPIGVYYNKNAKKFHAQLSINGETKYLGLFDDPQEGHKIYLEAKKQYVIEKMEDYPDQRIKKVILKGLFDFNTS